MLESLLNNVATLLERNFISNFIFKGTYFVDHLRSAASVIIFPDAAFLKIKFISHNLPNQKPCFRRTFGLFLSLEFRSM